MWQAVERFYFWASLGNVTRTLALWTNSGGDLIVQNRWSETQRGVVSGRVSADAWAIFRHSDRAKIPTKDGGSLAEAVNASRQTNRCESLNGAYRTEGQIVASDGRLDRRTAAAHFFREEIVGADAVREGTAEPMELELIQDESTSITINLHSPEGLLASRLLPAKDIDCVQGKWEYDGAVRAHSAWLLMAASGGVYWENLSLWRDPNGDLLVKGVYKSRAVLLLVPFGRTETIFVAFAGL